MVPVSSILVLGKASFEKMDFSAFFSSAERVAVGEAYATGGGGFYTEKRKAL